MALFAFFAAKIKVFQDCHTASYKRNGQLLVYSYITDYSVTSGLIASGRPR